MADRIVRDRGSVGRRIWRRRKKRSAGAASPQAPGANAAPGEGELDDEEEREADEAAGLEDETALAEPPPSKPSPKKGFFAALADALRGRGAPAPAPEPSYLVVDPTRPVLAIPRGAARLDAFEQAVVTTPSTSPHFRALALAFHKELLTLAEGAGVDLSLFEKRVEACAKALVAAGEDERAGTLFLRVGRKHQAAELFVAAGAVEALEEAHAQIHWDEGGPRHEARLLFERFEALFVVGMREPALACLERAQRLWHDNPVYAEILRTFHERLGSPHRLKLTTKARRLHVVARWPVVIGRGEDAGVQLASPLISRAHLQVELVGDALFVADLESRGGTSVGSTPLAGRTSLLPGADIDMAGVVVHTRIGGGALWLWPALAAEDRTLAVLRSTLQLPPPDALVHHETTMDDGAPAVRFDEKGRAVLEPPAVLNGEALRRPTLLLAGDKVSSMSSGWTWTVATR